MTIKFKNITEATEYAKEQGLDIMTSNDANKLKINDVLKIMIYNELEDEITFSLISTITHITSHDRAIKFKDVYVYVEPESYSSDADNEESWIITIDDIGTHESHAFFFKLMGTSDDFPEYFL